MYTDYYGFRGIDRRKIDRGVFSIENKGSTEIDVPMDRDRRALGFRQNPKWWYRILQIDRNRLVQHNLESAWGLAIAGCCNSDGLSEQNMEIVAVGLLAGR